MSLFIVQASQITDGIIYFSKNDSIHLYRVLRKKKGDKITCKDNTGKTYSCVISEISSNKASAEIKSLQKHEDQSSNTAISLIFPLIKGKRTQWLIQKCTEIGVNTFLPYAYTRSVVKPDPDNNRMKRYIKIIHEACKQSERSDIPVLNSIMISFSEIESYFTNKNKDFLKILLWEKEKKVYLNDILRDNKNKINNVCIAVGPEGSMTDNEILSFKKLGFSSAGLKTNILRSETACIFAASVCVYELF